MPPGEGWSHIVCPDPIILVTPVSHSTRHHVQQRALLVKPTPRAKCWPPGSQRFDLMGASFWTITFDYTTGVQIEMAHPLLPAPTPGAGFSSARGQAVR